MSDSRCVEKYNRKKGDVNAELVKAAVDARKNGYASYGKMQTEEYIRLYTSNLKQEIEQKRKEGYQTVRERMEEQRGEQKNV